MRARKIVISIFIVFIVAIAIAFFNLSAIVKNNFEQNVSQALGVNAKIENLNLQLFSGHVDIKGLVVSNPLGFSTPHFFKIGEFEFQVKPNTILNETVEVETFKLKEVSVNIEQQVNKNNILEVLDHIEKQKGKEDKNQKKLRLKLASVDNIALKLTLSQFGVVLSTLNLSLPNIELKNIGTDDVQGVLLSELTRQLVSAIVKEVLIQNKQNIPDSILQMFKSKMMGSTALSPNPLFAPTIAPKI
ncbi:hypothetical protein V2H45_06725 [Tumidithrix elongata RA019]|uniref:AsmA domain-containing protein n=1 Tax=Tumidithrix elongata BACA0141 TaxID=2716417 RepID=A0AAW9PVR7_9CYAN|nr:hypothetical protein [Tumidithrix elongata RA019]